MVVLLRPHVRVDAQLLSYPVQCFVPAMVKLYAAIRVTKLHKLVNYTQYAEYKYLSITFKALKQISIAAMSSSQFRLLVKFMFTKRFNCTTIVSSGITIFRKSINYITLWFLT